MPFFRALVDFLEANENVNLRQIHAAFAEEDNLDRKIDQLIAAGLILREDKRYSLGFELFDDASNFDLELKAPAQLNSYAGPLFLRAGSDLEQRLSASHLPQTLENQTNSVKLHFDTTFDLSTENLPNYFHKVAEMLPLSQAQMELYQLLGDVDPEYALKYMTTFLLKFLKKESVNSSRPDIFVQSLERLGMIEKTGEKSFELRQKFAENLVIPSQHFECPKDFIQAQIGQTQAFESFISIGE